jgi:hypothetical protein
VGRAPETDESVTQLKMALTPPLATPIAFSPMLDPNLSEGSDIRLDGWCENFTLPLKKGWWPYLVKDDGKTRVVFANKKGGNVRVSRKAPTLNVNRFPVGFEFRVMDHFPSELLQDFMALLVLLMTADNALPRLNSDWAVAMSETFKHGFAARLPQNYVATLEEAFQVRLPRSRPQEVLQALATGLHASHGGDCESLMGGPTHAPTIPDINGAAFSMHLQDMMTADIRLQREFASSRMLGAKHQNDRLPLQEFKASRSGK